MAKVVTTMDVAARNRMAHLRPDQALPRMMKKHGRFVFSICLAYCGDEDRARDLTQEIFRRAYRSWESFEGRSSVSTWLYTIARRTCFRLERRRAGEPRHKMDVDSIGVRVPAADAVPEADYAGFDPLEHLIEEETADLVRRAISHLPIRYRLPLVLKELGTRQLPEVETNSGRGSAGVFGPDHGFRIVTARQAERRTRGGRATRSAPFPGLEAVIHVGHRSGLDRCGLEGDNAACVTRAASEGGGDGQADLREAGSDTNR